MQGFAFKPAVLRGGDNWTIDSGMLTRNGELYCSFANVKSARFAQMSTNRTHSAWLDLQTDLRNNRIGCNMPPGSADYVAFISLCTAVFEQLDQQEPKPPVAIGAGGGVRWSMFILGILTAIFGLFMAIMGLAGAVNRGTELGAIGGGCAAIVFGGWLGWSFRPWAPPLLLGPSVARDYVARLAPQDEPAKAEQQGEAPEQPEG